MFKTISQMVSLMRQAQQMGGKVEEIGDRLRAKTVTASAGAGLVVVEANGLAEILRVTIDSTLVERGQRDVIEDLLPAAINQALAQAKQLHMNEMKAITEGLEIPGLDQILAKVSGLSGDPASSS